MHAATAATGWTPTEDRARAETPARDVCRRSEAFAEDLREPPRPRPGWRWPAWRTGFVAGRGTDDAAWGVS